MKKSRNTDMQTVLNSVIYSASGILEKISKETGVPIATLAPGGKNLIVQDIGTEGSTIALDMTTGDYSDENKRKSVMKKNCERIRQIIGSQGNRGSLNGTTYLSAPTEIINKKTENERQKDTLAILKGLLSRKTKGMEDIYTISTIGISGLNNDEWFENITASTGSDFKSITITRTQSGEKILNIVDKQEGKPAREIFHEEVKGDIPFLPDDMFPSEGKELLPDCDIER